VLQDDVRRLPEVRNFGDTIATLNDLPHGFIFKFWGITLIAHSLPPMLVE
jgi:hypothetical protein